MEELAARGIQVLIALSVTYLVALWFVLVVWTYRDSEGRSRSVVTQVFSTLLVVLFYLPGLLLYLILRPKETLDAAFQRSLEEEYLLQDLEELPHCPSCHRYVEDDYRLCPHCQTQLRESCVSCGRLVDLKWSLCPFCGEVQGGRESRPSIKIAEPPERYIAPSSDQSPTAVPGPSRLEPLPYPDMTPALDEADQTEPAAIRALTAESEAQPIRPFDRRYTRAAAALREKPNGDSPSKSEPGQLEVVDFDQANSGEPKPEKNGRFRRNRTSVNGTNGSHAEPAANEPAEDEELDDLEATSRASSGEK
jgi:RNA polymerase subunit RPABC4/transcription elongation factor Spt4